MGRKDEVRKLLDYLTTPGQHAILYGERGVGKSSLARVVSQHFYKRMADDNQVVWCANDDTFENILSGSLISAGYDIDKEKHIETKKESGGVDASALVVKGKVTLERTKQITYGSLSGKLTPSKAAKALRKSDGILIVDELDRIKPEEVSKLAETMKLLSDCRSPFKMLLVGIASNISELIDGHKSVERCLMQTKLHPMSDSELKEIISKGEEICAISFSELVVKQIVQLSAGYPHFAHLLALKSGELSILDKTRKVNHLHLRQAIATAADESDETLKIQYQKFARPGKLDMKKMILISLAKLGGTEYTTKEIRDMLERLFSYECTSSAVSQNMRGLASNNSDTILMRIKNGIFRFNDPRMVNYIRIVNHEYFSDQYL